MKKYIEQLKDEHTPHERRRVAMQVAGVITALLFVVWISTLGVRLSQNSAATAQNFDSTAATLMAVQGATTTLGQ